PLFFAFISLTLPAGIVVYFLVSNLFRIGQQAFITRTMYSGTDGALATTAREVDTSSTAKPKGIMAQMREMGLPNPGQAKEEVRAAKGATNAKAKGTTTKAGAAAPKRGATATTAKPTAPVRKASGPSRTAPQNANRSQKKKKRK
ncbi:MAG TPA: hypothetical protein VHK88_13310, partial [Aquihabitans sp.]|nr:hypothetical protein [Aquihabitans sp.]